MIDDDDDRLVIEDDSGEAAVPAVAPWRILVVDDDPAVHSGTHYSLRDFLFERRPVHLLSAYSAEEASRVLAGTDDVAVILLDVVMETDEAGLRFARWVRNELGNQNTRIILRTGQPGLAPERTVMADYDLNDYRAKTGLNDEQLFTAITTALRSYEQVSSLEAHRRALDLIIETSAELLETPSIEHFRRVMLDKIGLLLGAGIQGSVGELAPDGPAGGARLVPDGPTLGDSHPELVPLVRRALAEGGIVFNGTGSVVAVHCPGAPTQVAIYPGFAPSGDHQRAALAAFCGKLNLAYRNVHLVAALNAANAELEERVRERTQELSQVILELREREADLRERDALMTHKAHHDPLTGLPNRTMFNHSLQLEISFADLAQNTFSLIFLDLDRFKPINDRYGHAAGDELLRQVASRLRQAAQPADIVARLGGDEFAIIAITGLDPPRAAAERVASRCLEALDLPFAVSGREVRIGVSIGIAICPDDGLDVGRLMNHADAALYQAKNDGRGRLAFYQAG